MIDKSLLRQLGWSDELIEEACREAGNIASPTEYPIETVGQWGEQRCMVSTSAVYAGAPNTATSLLVSPMHTPEEFSFR